MPKRPTQSHELTLLTSLDAFKPCMTKLWVASISALIVPSTATHATTALARFLTFAALGTLVGAYHGYACRRGCFWCFSGDAGVHVTEHALIPAQKTNTVE